jgi:hypothetical protein
LINLRGLPAKAETRPAALRGPVRRGGLFASLRPANRRLALQPSPQNCGATNTFFYSRKDTETQRNGGALGLTSGGLCGLAALRDKYFFSFFF